jgi:hypothetical protein
LLCGGARIARKYCPPIHFEEENPETRTGNIGHFKKQPLSIHPTLLQEEQILRSHQNFDKIAFLSVSRSV